MHTAEQTTSNKEDANAFYSVDVELQGRMMLEDYSEQKCIVTQMSPAKALFSAPSLPNVGERIIGYIEQVGRLEGIVSNISNGHFQVLINATPRKQSKLAAQLTWLANKGEFEGAEDRRHQRDIPKNLNSEVRLEDGRTYPCRIIDLSVSGAAFEIDVKPELNSILWLGSMKGRVIRHFDTGVSMEFLVMRPLEELELHATS